jgi:probable addiction module antidote protein
MKAAAKWDTSEFLTSDEDIVAYLNAALEDGDQALVTAALGNIARAKGMTQLAKETGITRDGLYKALSPGGNPSFGTVQKVVKALGFKLDVAIPA